MQHANPAFLLLGAKTVSHLLSLEVRPEEEHLIAPNPAWMAQAAFTDRAITYGVFMETRAVGLISLIDPRLANANDRDHLQEGCLYVWRVMMDREARGRGLGSAAMRFTIGYAKLIGLDGVSLTTMDRKAHNALKFYRKLGFEPTGRRLDDEIELVWRSDTSAG